MKGYQSYSAGSRCSSRRRKKFTPVIVSPAFQCSNNTSQWCIRPKSKSQRRNKCKCKKMPTCESCESPSFFYYTPCNCCNQDSSESEQEDACCCMNNCSTRRTQYQIACGNCNCCDDTDDDQYQQECCENTTDESCQEFEVPSPWALDEPKCFYLVLRRNPKKRNPGKKTFKIESLFRKVRRCRGTSGSLELLPADEDQKSETAVQGCSEIQVSCLVPDAYTVSFTILNHLLPTINTLIAKFTFMKFEEKGNKLPPYLPR
ncbi:hypothetical protein WDU94_015247 [Cyamophila willieti]